MTAGGALQGRREDSNGGLLVPSNDTLTTEGNVAASRSCVHSFSFCGDSGESCLRFFFILSKQSEEVRSVWSHPLPFGDVEALYPMITHFVFPILGPSCSAKDLIHTFVLTDSHGVRMFGHCTALVNGDTVVSLSPYPWCRFFTQLAMLFRTNGYERGKELVCALCKAPTPPPGGSFALPTIVSFDLRRPYDRLCPFIDTSPLDLLTIFPQTSDLFSVLADLLLEKHIIVAGPNFGLVSRVVLSLQALLSPFGWTHVLAPVLPTALLGVLAAPLPYLVGALTSQLPLLAEVPMERLVVVHLGLSGTCENVAYYGEEEHTLPNSGMFSALWIGYNTLKMRDPQDRTARDLCSLFLTYYATLLGDLGVGSTESHTQPQSKLKESVFYKRLKNTQCYSLLVETVQKALGDNNCAWMDNEFLVAIVQGHASVYPQQHQQLAEEEKEGGRYTTRYENCFGSVGEMTALSAAIHGCGWHGMNSGRWFCGCLRNLICRTVYENDDYDDVVIVESSGPPVIQGRDVSIFCHTPDDAEVIVPHQNGTK